MTLQQQAHFLPPKHIIHATRGATGGATENNEHLEQGRCHGNLVSTEPSTEGGGGGGSAKGGACLGLCKEGRGEGGMGSM
ncbi:hypothetical protein E2C01_093112 [Portunus trituberculatus]|uniref:Uncharacterized protein n=1 Tax=Portunus trituberculatus TaxID=210409 RepID=A0A5B7JLY1_PORTR|nr:hypothetical protein [Portunus trituberculatus]